MKLSLHLTILILSSHFKVIFMFIQVKLLNGFKNSLTYKVPDDWNCEDLQGAIVQVPLQNRIELAFVESLTQNLDLSWKFKIKEAISLENIPIDAHYSKFIEHLSYYYQIDPIHFFKRVRHFLQEKEQSEEIPVRSIESEIKDVKLTPEQQDIVDTLISSFSLEKYYPALLHGVTGSGKTEIYKQLIIKTIKDNKSVVLLLPEVSLAVQFHELLKRQLPSDIAIFGFHSATSVKEKRILWQNLLAKKPMLIIGVHLPMLLPIPNLGLMLIDEEHDVGFQEKKHPKINTKEAAIMRANINNIPIILGSATPSISSLYNVKMRGWHFFELKNRFAGAFPTVTTVKLTDREKRKNFWISALLEKAILDRLEKKEQTIIFLNRRGHSFFVQCKNCAYVATCSNCSVSLTLHNDQKLKCHYCNYSQPEFFNCPSCKKNDLIKKGIGTQQVVTVLEKLFPSAKIARADLDTTINKKKWQQTMSDFQSGLIDILVGTQTITKGYNFPKVTLVGILWADINLNFPIYNSAEVTLQQLIQVAGRAGRQSAESSVIVQSMINHPIFKYLNEIDYIKFYSYELSNRELVKYPPFIRLAEIELKHENAALIDSEADTLADFLHFYRAKLNSDVIILGPAQPPVHMIKKTHMRKIYLKAADIKQILELYQKIDHDKFSSSIFFTPNPLN